MGRRLISKFIFFKLILKGNAAKIGWIIRNWNDPGVERPTLNEKACQGRRRPRIALAQAHLKMLEKEEESFYRARNMCVCATRTALVACSPFVHFFSFLWFIYKLHSHLSIFRDPAAAIPARTQVDPTPSLVGWPNQVAGQWECKTKKKERWMDERQKTGKMGRDEKINLGHPPCTESSTLHSLFYAFHSLYATHFHSLKNVTPSTAIGALPPPT